jgi:predicted phage tail protein
MLRDIYLYGVAGRRFGRHHRLDVASPNEAVRALCTFQPELRAVLRQGYWRIIVGPPHLQHAVPLAAGNMNMGKQPLHLVPATPPAGDDTGKVVGTIVVGIALVGAAFALAPAAAAGAGFLGANLAADVGVAAGIGAIGMSAGSLALMGVSLAAAGVAALLTQHPKQQAGEQATDQARPEDRPSFLFNGVTNNSQEGGPVPLVIGTHLVGSIVVSAGLKAEDIGV